MKEVITMKTRKLLSFALALFLLTGLLTACGASSAPSNKYMAMDSVMMQESAAEAPREPMEFEEAGTGNSLTTSGTEGSAALPESRKWIITVDLQAETEDLDAMMESLDEHIAALNGYVEDQRIYNGSSYSNRRYRNANLTIRIPAEDVDHFTEKVTGIANVVSNQKNLEDITLTYVSTESRMKALQTEEARLLELMAQAETMSDLLEIEGRLTDVRYELESVTSRLRTYDNQVNYATIYLYIEEVQEYTPIEEPTFWERISGGFTDSLEGLKDGTLDLLVWVLANSPYLVVYGILGTGIYFLSKKIKFKKMSRKAKKQMDKEQ